MTREGEAEKILSGFEDAQARGFIAAIERVGDFLYRNGPSENSKSENVLKAMYTAWAAGGDAKVRASAVADAYKLYRDRKNSPPNTSETNAVSQDTDTARQDYEPRLVLEMTRDEEAEKILSEFNQDRQSSFDYAVDRIGKFLAPGESGSSKSEDVLRAIYTAWTTNPPGHARGEAVVKAYARYHEWEKRLPIQRAAVNLINADRREYELKLILGISVNNEFTPDEVITRARQIAELVYPPVEVSNSFNAS